MRVRGYPERGDEEGGKADLETFAIASHNMGAEYEHLGKFNEAVMGYQDAVAAAEVSWGYSHGKTLNMRCLAVS